MKYTETPRPAEELLPDLLNAWAKSGTIAILLDFDGTLAPIVEDPDHAAISEELRATLGRVAASVDGLVAIISGRGLEDVRQRVGLPAIAYAGNHGMEIEAPGLVRVHPEAVAARPLLERVAARLKPELNPIPGAILEDKGLTLTIHYRRTDRTRIDELKRLVRLAAADFAELAVTEGKEILEIRPKVEWHKGRAVEFLLEWAAIPESSPAVYIGDDVTDEDAYKILRQRGNGVAIIVGEPPYDDTAAHGYLSTTEEVAKLLDLLVLGAPQRRV